MIPPDAFDEIIQEVHRKPLEVNDYRKKAGKGKSQAFAIVGKRSQKPDYSRQCWKRAYLFKLLLEFGEKYVDIPYNAITLNHNYQSNPHYDKNNVGDSFLVAFGTYSGGELLIHEGKLTGVHNIYCKPIVTDFSKVLHSVKPFTGERFSLVYYFYDDPKWEIDVPPPSVKKIGDEWVFFRGDEAIDKNIGLPHPLRGYKRKIDKSSP